MRDLTSTEENDTPQLSAGDNLGNTYDGLVLTNTSCQGKQDTACIAYIARFE